ncbi:hypothetical protein BCR39DRAFT_182396 [Naematelia encephala]|uniref:DUF1275 domain protein n=1 Tax=Naematelia encephala TaxID=71784 RepID=A0A1Y2B4H4_9TREE|nr:hypothetical protein BCR39DRAFT_182396 [Naematelia encephala]
MQWFFPSSLSRSPAREYSLADSVTYKAYQTFATSQTGNTVSLAVAALGSSSKSPLLPGVSLAGFVVSGLIFGQLGGYFGHHRRGWLLLSFTFQLVILAAASLIVAKSNQSHSSQKTTGWVHMLLLAVQGGPQVTMATNAGCREIPTAMMTTPYAAFISDPTIFQSGQGIDVRARNRRALYIAVFWAGALVGAAISSLCWMSIIVGGCKVVAMGLVVLAKGEVGDQIGADGGVKDGGEEDEVYSGFQHIVRDERNVAM